MSRDGEAGEAMTYRIPGEWKEEPMQKGPGHMSRIARGAVAFVSKHAGPLSVVSAALLVVSGVVGACRHDAERSRVYDAARFTCYQHGELTDGTIEVHGKPMAVCVDLEGKKKTVRALE